MQFNWKKADDPISLLLRANNNNNNVCNNVMISGLSFSLLDSIQNKISVRQSLKVETDSCAFDCESDM